MIFTMKTKWYIVVVLILVVLIAVQTGVMAQCSVCTKTAQQLGPKAAKGLNAGILYLAFAPLAIASVIGYRWWKSNKE
jgi:hypothetical protein